MKLAIEILKTIAVFAFCIFILIISGCATTYEIERCEGETCITAKIKSYREFSDGLALHYDKEAGTFEFSANKVSTQVSPLEQAAADVIRQLQVIPNE